MPAIDLSSLMALERGELVRDTGRAYDGLTPVRIRVRKRGGRFDFSDDGGAVEAAGADRGRLAFDDRIVMGEYSVNVSKQGVVWLPGFVHSNSGWLAKLPLLVTDGSLALYEALLELAE